MTLQLFPLLPFYLFIFYLFLSETPVDFSGVRAWHTIIMSGHYTSPPSTQIVFTFGPKRLSAKPRLLNDLYLCIPPASRSVLTLLLPTRSHTSPILSCVSFRVLFSISRNLGPYTTNCLWCGDITHPTTRGTKKSVTVLAECHVFGSFAAAEQAIARGPSSGKPHYGTCYCSPEPLLRKRFSLKLRHHGTRDPQQNGLGATHTA
jgi:hypothetical protein